MQAVQEAQAQNHIHEILNESLNNSARQEEPMNSVELYI